MWIPWGVVSDHEVEDGEEFAHGGDEGGHLGFALGLQAQVERADRGVVPGGDEGGHVEGLSDMSASAAGGAFAAHESGVAVDRRHADDSGDLLPVGVAEFRQFGDERAGGCGPDAGHRLENGGALLHCLVSLDDGGDLSIDVFELRRVEGDGLANQTTHCGIAGARQAVLLRRTHANDLTPAGDQRGQLHLVLAGQFTWPRRHNLSIARDEACVDSVGLGRLSRGTRDHRSAWRARQQVGIFVCVGLGGICLDPGIAGCATAGCRGQARFWERGPRWIVLNAENIVFCRGRAICAAFGGKADPRTTAPGPGPGPDDRAPGGHKD